MAATASLLMLTAACGHAADAAGSGYDGPPPIDGDAVVLRVEYTGGFVPPSINTTRLPLISIYADGRVISEGPTTKIYPGPALPNVQLARISRDDVEKLIAHAERAGVGTAGDLGTPGITDVPSTLFTVQTKDGVKKLEVYALSYEADDQNLTAHQKAARAKLRKLVAELTDLTGTLGAKSVSESEPYRPSAVAAVASPWVASGDTGLPKSPEVVWPGPKLPGASLGEGLNIGCVTASGDDASAVLKAATSATSITPWVSDGKRWTLIVRPLLPDESSCADLTL